ncbi:hypothetical protein GCM10028818_52550 [Spirosoma horti]
MEDYSFSEEAVTDAIKSAQATHSDATASTKGIAFDMSKGGSMQDGPLSIAAQCISVTTANHKICINLPLGIGKRCFTLPVNVPNGTVGKACLSICTTFGIPTGVRVTVVIGGVTVISQSFGKC